MYIKNDTLFCSNTNRITAHVHNESLMERRENSKASANNNAVCVVVVVTQWAVISYKKTREGASNRWESSGERVQIHTRAGKAQNKKCNSSSMETQVVRLSDAHWAPMTEQGLMGLQ